VNNSVAVVDYGAGNILNVVRAFEFLGVEVEVVSDAREIPKSAALVIPGVGDFGAGSRGLAADGLDGAIRDFTRSGKAVLGICLGMQLCAEDSDESPGFPGLGLIDGHVLDLHGLSDPSGETTVPDTGWARVDFSQSIFGGPPRESQSYYFSHSYYLRPRDSAAIVATKAFGDTVLPAVVAWENVIGLQFHPEKSGHGGIHLLHDWMASH
jgi:glutamine amidotransferase